MGLVIGPKVYKYVVHTEAATSRRRVVKRLKPKNIRYLQSLGFQVCE